MQQCMVFSVGKYQDRALPRLDRSSIHDPNRRRRWHEERGLAVRKVVIEINEAVLVSGYISLLKCILTMLNGTKADRQEVMNRTHNLH
jgi:hypothetical protein